MEVLITGAAGFIGSRLAAHLVRKKNKVTLVDNLSWGHLDNLFFDDLGALPLVEMDIRKDDIRSIVEGADAVIHLAGISSLPACQANPYEAFDVNVGGTIKVLEACRVAGVPRILFSSTSAVYENTAQTPFDESADVQPNLVYSLSKYVAEQVVSSYVTNYGLPASSVRFFNVYGPHQDYKRVNPPLIPYICSTLAKGEQPKFFSDGRQLRDYIYVDDVIDLLDRLISLSSFPAGKTINACSGEVASITDIYSLIRKHFSGAPEPIFAPGGTFWDNFPSLFEAHYPFERELVSKEVDKFSRGSNSLAHSSTGWLPTTNLEEGVSKVVAFVQSEIGGLSPSRQQGRD